MNDPDYTRALDDVTEAFPNLPADVTESLARYETAVIKGEVKPWNPDAREEGWVGRADCDTWIGDHIASHMPTW